MNTPGLKKECGLDWASASVPTANQGSWFGVRVLAIVDFSLVVPNPSTSYLGRFALCGGTWYVHQEVVSSMVVPKHVVGKEGKEEEELEDSDDEKLENPLLKISETYLED